MTQSRITPEVLTADYVGSPGDRAFFIQARSSSATHTVGVEKVQVTALAEKMGELLLMVDDDDTVKGAQPARDPALGAVPEVPEWRAGTMALAYDEERDTVTLVVEAIGESEEEAPDADADADGVAMVLRRDQVRAFVLHALAVVAEGRPVCQLCGLPMDPEGHVCPASNGHHAHS